MSKEIGHLVPTREWKPREQRTTATFLIARLMRDNGQDELCRIRNVSPGGMRVETPRQLDLEHRVQVELRSGVLVGGRVAWTNPGAAGIQFDTVASIDELLGGPSDRTFIPRSPRFAAETPARLSFCGRIRPAILENVSQSGARVRIADPELVQGEMTVAIPGLEPKRAAMRWVAADEAGLVFLDKLKFQEFGHWLGEPRYRYGARAS